MVKVNIYELFLYSHISKVCPSQWKSSPPLGAEPPEQLLGLGSLFVFHRCACLWWSRCRSAGAIRKQLSASNLFMSDMLFLMKALAALHNQLAISQLIFHPAVVMSSARARAQYIIPRCYDKPRPPGARGGIWTLLGPRVKSLPFVAEIMAAGLLVDGQWNKGRRQTTNRSGGHLNKPWRGEGWGVGWMASLLLKCRRRASLLPLVVRCFCFFRVLDVKMHAAHWGLQEA